MTTAAAPTIAVRQVAFFATVSGGKVHAAHKISHVAVCGIAAELEPTPMLHTAAGSRVHPMACKRCVRSTAVEGASALGVEQ